MSELIQSNILDGNPFATTHTIRFLLQKRLALPKQRPFSASSPLHSHVSPDDTTIQRVLKAPKEEDAPDTSCLELKYFYLYWDEDKAKTDPDQTTRHPLALLSSDFVYDPISLNSVCEAMKIPLFDTLYETFSTSTLFYHAKLNLNIPSIVHGEFKNVTILESLEPMNLECTTTVFSYGTRILETIQTVIPIQKSDQRYSYATSMVNGFFTTFFNGLQELGEDSIKNAVRHLRLIQIFSVSKETDNIQEIYSEPPILCLTYELDTGEGSVQLFQLWN